MVKRTEIPVADRLANKLHTFLSKHHHKFRIGTQPVEQYIARNNLQVPIDVLRGLIELQRIYKITSAENEVTNGLLSDGVHSASDVAQGDQDEPGATDNLEIKPR